jgi:predicted GH43/DUF377 family glycosyl hydrolase
MAFKWVKKGRIFNPATDTDRSFIQEFAQAPATLIFDDFVRIYFSCRPKRDENGQYKSYSAYIDVDRGNLFNILRVAENPILPLGDRGTFDEYGTYPVSVIRRDDEFWCYYAGWTRCVSVPFNVAIGLAVSKDDGKSFTKGGSGPILSYTLDEPFVLSGPKIRRFNDQYYLFYIAGDKWILDEDRPEPIYTIRMATSNDGLVWQKHNKKLIPPRIEDDEAQASPDVIFYNGKYHMFFCYRKSKQYRSKEGGYRIGYAWSDDLENWNRSDHETGIDISEAGWDNESISYPHVFELDGKLYMLYLGNEVGRYGFGLAELETA